MKLVDLFEREVDLSKIGYGPRRNQLIAAVSQSTHDPKKLRDPNYLMTVTKSLISRPPYSYWDEKAQRSVLRDVMNAFGITPDEHNSIRFMTR